MYKTGCELQDGHTHINVYVAPQFQVQELGTKCLEKIWTKTFSESEIKKHKKNVILREHLVTLDVPQQILDQGPYCLRLQILSKSGEWKSNWAFEGFGVVQGEGEIVASQEVIPFTATPKATPKATAKVIAT